ncbi:hypothetical protein [Aestuariirhabdus litorea]|uniref:Cation/multidrug efflux pump n=1 Tax=Aestuariirhabdus litorea TaxID=2528527 RepID=A0A3P3VQ78_9GAMM|nr:hypothetical protein [Aestuariirhabdus litorea]RRJ84885.1 hypothetical protein D0544_07295 [Aestuariirhabdus litorea]RWW98111.1 hypothetical protein DZC74_07290 [Endozoicomonadaceae bacterium GTF-13]
MIYGGIAVGVGLVALLLLYVAFKLLGGNWLLAWLRGSAGLLVLAAAGVTALLGWDTYSYTPVSGTETLATISFSQQGEQQFRAVVADRKGAESLVELQGELWRLGVRRVSWSPVLSRLGLSPGYRLADITARYLSIEQEQQADRKAEPLAVSQYGVDGWQLIQLVGTSSLLQAGLAQSDYLPMVDGGLYRVDIVAGEVRVEAVNDSARAALAQWR